MNGPLALSVVIPTYNRLGELRTMLDSLLPQISGKPVEVLIVDDCSTDETWAWLTAHFANMTQVTCLRAERNGGPGPARNLALAAARGRYFVPFDSDFIVLPDAIGSILKATREESGFPLLFFPCLRFPGMSRLDRLSGRRRIDYETFLVDDVGELIPVADLAFIRNRQLGYPDLRAGGEGILWAQILSHGPALFLDTPVALYRTDVDQRICTLEYQLKNPASMAAVADAIVEMLDSGTSSVAIKSVRARKCLAAGAYHLLAGNPTQGRRRLWSALSLGYWPAAPALAASFGGRRFFRMLFRIYRTRLNRAYA